MIIKLSPVRSNEAIEVVKTGDTLAINDETFDFTELPEGATLPSEAIESDHFAGPVERINGELRLTLRLPHDHNPSQSVAFPQPITVNVDGPVELPQ